MNTTNQILVQLSEANRFANAKSPHYRRLAVIVLDNLVEVQLARKAKLTLMLDQTSWFNGVRKHASPRRWQIENRFNELLKFSRENNWIDDRDVQLLKYAHRVRNAFYHRAEQNELDGELAIVLLQRFIKKRFPKWGNASIGFFYGRGEPISIENSGEDGSGVRPIHIKGMRQKMLASGPGRDSEAYWTEAVNTLLTYKPKIGIRKLIHKRATEMLDEIQRDLEIIEENKNLNLLDVMIHRFAILTPAFTNAFREGKRLKSTASAINIYLALLKAEPGKASWEERLHDEPDPNNRAKQFHQLLKNHKPVKPLTVQQIEKYRAQVDAILKKNEAEGIKTFLRIETETEEMADVLDEFSFDIDGYINHLVDEARGK